MFEFLNWVVSDPSREGEWVELLSLLEFVGCRKIVKGVPFENMNLSVLTHLSEEALHAVLLKKCAVELRGDKPWTEGKLSLLGWNYFQTLDKKVSLEKLPASKNYQRVSWAIERRVLEVYPAYLNLTQNKSVKKALGLILAQEKKHATLFESVEISELEKQGIIEIEEQLWLDFLRGLHAVAKETALPVG